MDNYFHICSEPSVECNRITIYSDQNSQHTEQFQYLDITANK